MSSEGILLFGNDSGGGGAGSEYEKQNFVDTSVPANSNVGFSSTASRNPFNAFFGNDGAPKWMSKTLYIQDMVVVEDRSLWINGRTTYKIIWNESFPGVNGYAFGNVNVGGNVESKYLNINFVGDGFGVGGVIRRVQWLVKPSTGGTATAAQSVDGSGIGNIDFSSAVSGSTTQGKAIYNAYTHASTNETRDIHDYRLSANQAGNLIVYGVVVYFEVPASGIDCFAGNLFLDKTLLSPVGTTLAFPTAGTSNFLGGKAGVFLTQQAGFGITTSLVQDLQTPAIGNSLTNLVNVNSGLGGSFPQGTAIWCQNGATHYLGAVLSRSGDVLTVGPTLTQGVSNILHALFQAGHTFAISSTLFQQSWDYSPGVNQEPAQGPTFVFSRGLLDYSDPQQRFRVWGATISMAFATGNSLSFNSSPTLTILPGLTMGIAFPAAASGFIQIDGFMSGLELEFAAGISGSLNHTLVIDGLVTTSLNETLGGAGLFRKTVFTNGGYGWHSVRITAGAGSTQTMITRALAYEPSLTNGPTLGILAEIPLYMTFIQRDSAGATQIAFGNVQRLYADNLYWRGSWARSLSNLGNAAGGVIYTSTNVGDIMQFSYFGTRYLITGVAAAASMTVAVNGVTDTGFTLNSWAGTGLTLGFQTVVLTSRVVTSKSVAAVDFYSPVGQVENLQAFTPTPEDAIGVRFFSQTSPPSGARPGDIWELDKNNSVAFQHIFGGWKRLNIGNPSCYVSNYATTFAVADNTEAPAQADTLNFDPYGMVTTIGAGATLTFTIPADGDYEFKSCTTWVAAATGYRDLRLKVLKTGNEGAEDLFVLSRVPGSSVTNLILPGSIVLHNLKKGQKLVPALFQVSGAPTNNVGDPASNWSQLTRIGP